MCLPDDKQQTNNKQQHLRQHIQTHNTTPTTQPPSPNRLPNDTKPSTRPTHSTNQIPQAIHIPQQHHSPQHHTTDIVDIKPATPSTSFTLRFTNCTHAGNTTTVLASSHVGAICIVEHIELASRIPTLRSAFHGLGWNTELGQLDPQKEHNAWGVGALSRDPRQLTEHAPNMQASTVAHALGRAAIYNIGTCHQTKHTNTTAAIYGWQGSTPNTAAASRASQIMLSAEEELGTLPPSPQRMVGDLNADPHDVTAYHHLTQQGWTDLGAHAHPQGAIANLPTCLTTGALAPTRRDYTLANSLAMQFIINFQAVQNCAYAVHSPIDVHFILDDDTFQTPLTWKPRSLVSLKDSPPLPPALGTKGNRARTTTYNTNNPSSHTKLLHCQSTNHTDINHATNTSRPK